ncbi:MAG: TolC family protein [Candidatus Omnitrophica bacterium]|nr:TolC family protein [Candidatus Omnitrophota bacterium]
MMAFAAWFRGHTRWVILILLLAANGCLRVRLPEAHLIPGRAQEGMMWQRAVQLALAHHPDLRQARETLSAKAHNRNQALGTFLPTVDGTVSRKRARTTTSSTNNSLALDLDVTQPLFTGFETTGEALKAWREWEAARWAYVEESATVRQALRIAFVELLRLYQLLDVDRKIAARRHDNAELLRLRYEAGREHEGSWRRAQAIAEQAAFDVRQSERQIESQSLALGRQLGGYFAVPMAVAGELEQLMPRGPEPPSDYVALAEKTPFVQRLTRSAEAQQAALLSSQAALWPTVEGTFNYGYSGTSASNLKDDSTLGVTVSVPLFHGGRNVQSVLESNAEYQAAVEAARSVRDLRIAELGERWAAFRDAWELVAVKYAFLEAARQRAEIVHAQYTTGLANFQDFDIAEQELADSEKASVQSLANVLTEEAKWIFTKGGTLEEASDAK